MKWFLFAFIYCCLLFELSQQQTFTCADCPPTTASCFTVPAGSFTFVVCDGLCVSCARYIVYPCSSCFDPQSFCYWQTGSGVVECLPCSQYPSFCAGPYEYGSLNPTADYAFNSSNIQFKPNAINKALLPLMKPNF